MRCPSSPILQLPLVLAAACTSRSIADEHRLLGTIDTPRFGVELRATLMAWHHPAGCRNAMILCDWEPRHDRAAVGYDVWVHDAGGRILRAVGEADRTGWFEAPCPGRGHGDALHSGRATYLRLRHEICAGPDRFVYRVRDPGAEAPDWRAGIVLPDRVLYGFVDGEAAGCDGALGNLPAAGAWMRDRARGACGGLPDPADALRCEMREVDPRMLGVASRGVPSPGVVDAGLADAVLDPAAGDTSRYAPYRVRVLVDAVPDPPRLAGIQARLETRCAGDCLPWERLAATRIATRREDRAACLAALDGLDALVARGDEAGAAAVLEGVRGCSVGDALERRMAALWVDPTPPLEDAWSCPPEQSVGPSMFRLVLPDIATEWAAAACPEGLVAEAVRRAVDPATPPVTRARAARIEGACRHRADQASIPG